MKLIVLDATTKTIRAALVGAVATSNPDFVVAYADSTDSTFAEASTDGQLNGTTDVTLVGAPASGVKRTIKSISVYNRDTAPVIVVIKLDVSGTQRILQRVQLVSGETWHSDELTKQLPGGSDTQVQFNDGNTLAGSSNFTYNKTTSVLTLGANPVLTAGTANGVLYLNGSKVATTGSVLTFDGTILTAPRINITNTGTGATFSSSGGSGLRIYGASGTNQWDLYLNGANVRLSDNTGGGKFVVDADANIYGVTVGRGAGAVSTNTAVGASALAANTSGASNVSLGWISLPNNTTGSYNVGVGAAISGVANGALGGNTTGSYNVAIGSAALVNNTTASNNTAVGYQAGYSNTTGANNTAVGYQAAYTGVTAEAVVAIGYRALYVNTGAYNTAVGTNSMPANTSGTFNAALGLNSLNSNTTGANNVAIGPYALNSNTTASYNTAVGYQSLYTNSTGDTLTAVGTFSGYSNTTGIDSTFIGYSAGYSNTTGAQNAALGKESLAFNTTGNYNTAIGRSALRSNTTASNNTAVGYQAGYSNQTGAYGTFLGYQAGQNATGLGNTLIGYIAGQALTTGVQNNFIGTNAGYLVTTGSKNVVLGQYSGNQGGLDIRTASNYIVLSDGDGNPRSFSNGSGLWSFGETGTILGRVHSKYCPALNDNSSAAANQRGTIVAYLPGSGTNDNGAFNGLLFISDNAVGVNPPQYIRAYSSSSGATPVFQVLHSGNVQNANNSYGAVSDIRIKENIVDATPKLDSLLKVRVVNFNLKDDAEKQKQIGVIAQEVEQVFPGLVETDGEGTKSVKYSVFVPMLVKAVQELNTRLQAAEAEIATLKGN